METLFPAFNRQEIEISSLIPAADRANFADMLRLLTNYTQEQAK